MTKKEIEQRHARRLAMEKRFSQQFEKMAERDDAFISSGTEGEFYFRIDEFPGEFALVIEYAENKKQAIRGIFGEDGDRFYLDEMDEDEMFAAMCQEVRNSF